MGPPVGLTLNVQSWDERDNDDDGDVNAEPHRPPPLPTPSAKEVEKRLEVALKLTGSVRAVQVEHIRLTPRVESACVSTY